MPQAEAPVNNFALDLAPGHLWLRLHNGAVQGFTRAAAAAAGSGC